MSEIQEADRERRVKFDLLLKVLSACVIPMFLYLRSLETELISARAKIVDISEHQVTLSKQNDQLTERVEKIQLVANEAIVSLGFVREALASIRSSISSAPPPAPRPRRRRRGTP